MKHKYRRKLIGKLNNDFKIYAEFDRRYDYSKDKILIEKGEIELYLLPEEVDKLVSFIHKAKHKISMKEGEDL